MWNGKGRVKNVRRIHRYARARQQHAESFEGDASGTCADGLRIDESGPGRVRPMSLVSISW